jgi:hypothetical protein
MDYMVVGDDGGYVHALRVIDKTDSEKTAGRVGTFHSRCSFAGKTPVSLALALALALSPSISISLSIDDSR